jgi:hypothetical protein
MVESCKKNKLLLDISKISLPNISEVLGYFGNLGYTFESIDGENDIIHSNKTLILDHRESIMYLDSEVYEDSIDVYDYISEHNYDLIFQVISQWDIRDHDSLLNLFEYIKSVMFEPEDNYHEKVVKNGIEIRISRKNGVNYWITETLLSNKDIHKCLVATKGSQFVFMV